MTAATIHPTAVLEGDVKIGAGSTIGALCYLKGPIVIGEGTTIHPHCVIGTEAEHRSLESKGAIVIGSRTVVRELTVVQRGTGDRETTIGDDCFLMDHIHIAHDCVLANGVTIAPNTVLAGHVRIQRGATVGVGTSIHQFSTLGAYAMIGMGSVITRDVPPLCTVAGNPARFLRFNKHHFAKLGIDESALQIVDGALTSESAAVRELMEAFKVDVRRKVLPLDRTKEE